MIMCNVKNFGRNLDFLLSTRHGLKAAAARAAGISVTGLGYILRGESSPTLETACNLASAVHVPVDDLMTAPSRFKRQYANHRIELVDQK